MAIVGQNESGISKALVSAVLLQWGAVIADAEGALAVDPARLEEILLIESGEELSPYEISMAGFGTASELEQFYDTFKVLIYADFEAYCDELNLDATDSLAYYCGCSAWELITTRPERLVWGLARYAQWRVLQAIRDERLTFTKVYVAYGLNVFSKMGHTTL